VIRNGSALIRCSQKTWSSHVLSWRSIDLSKQVIFVLSLSLFLVWRVDGWGPLNFAPMMKYGPVLKDRHCVEPKIDQPLEFTCSIFKHDLLRYFLRVQGLRGLQQCSCSGQHICVTIICTRLENYVLIQMLYSNVESTYIYMTFAVWNDCLCGLMVRFPGYRTVCFLWGTNWSYICYVEESRPPVW
jgi:hypothetical protein